MTEPVLRPERPASGATSEAMHGVPLMDPRRVYPTWGPAAEQAVVAVLRSHCYVKGPRVAAFESAFAETVGTAHAVAVDSCTDALWLVLRAVLADRPPEAREVILPPFTFVATAGAVVNAGGTPVFADVHPETWTLDPASVAEHLSSRTAAVLPVHLYGAPADVPGLRRVLAEAGSEAFLLEDAAQAVGATLEGRAAGALGEAGTFSFYPSKNLGAAGDGGIVTTDDAPLAARLRALREHGQTRKHYEHAEVGTNSRMDEMQAAVLQVKLAHLGAWTAARRRVAARYTDALEGLPLVAQRLLPGAESAWHLYTVRLLEAGSAAGRDALREALAARGVATGVYYPVPLDAQACFVRPEVAASSGAACSGATCPVAARLATEVLSLPCFPGLEEAEQDRVIEAVGDELAR